MRVEGGGGEGGKEVGVGVGGREGGGGGINIPPGVRAAYEVVDHLEHVRFDGFIHRRGVHESDRG